MVVVAGGDSVVAGGDSVETVPNSHVHTSCVYQVNTSNCAVFSVLWRCPLPCTGDEKKMTLNALDLPSLQ